MTEWNSLYNNGEALQIFMLSCPRTQPCSIHVIRKSWILTMIHRYFVKIPSVSFKQNIFCRFTKRNAITCKVDKQSGETFCLCTDQNKFYPKIKLFQLWPSCRWPFESATNEITACRYLATGKFWCYLALTRH